MKECYLCFELKCTAPHQIYYEAYFNIKNKIVFLQYLMDLSDHQPFIEMLQELEEARLLDLIPDWAYIRASSRLRMPTDTTSQRCDSYHQKSQEIFPLATCMQGQM